MLKYSLFKLDEGLGEPAYNYFLHTASMNVLRFSRLFHWHIEIIPQVDRLMFRENLN